MTVVLASNSAVIGATGTTLQITITPSYIISASGSVTVIFPEYYTNAGSDYMISSKTPTCSSNSGITVSSCSFDSNSKSLTLKYSYNNGLKSK